MRIVAIDPAPTKRSTLFDGEFKELSPGQIAPVLRELAGGPPILLCWDSPLTGPGDPSIAGQRPSDFSQSSTVSAGGFETGSVAAGLPKTRNGRATSGGQLSGRHASRNKNAPAGAGARRLIELENARRQSSPCSMNTFSESLH